MAEIPHTIGTGGDAVGAIDEPLHDGGLLRPIALARRLHSPVGLVEDEVQGEVLVGDGIRQRVPHRECPRIGHRQLISSALLIALGCSPDQARVLPQLLGVEEVDLSRLELLLIEGVFDYHQARGDDSVGGVQQSEPSLLVERRVVGEPQHYRTGVRLETVVWVTFEQRLDHCCRHDRLARPGGRRE